MRADESPDRGVASSRSLLVLLLAAGVLGCAFFGVWLAREGAPLSLVSWALLVAVMCGSGVLWRSIALAGDILVTVTLGWMIAGRIGRQDPEFHFALLVAACLVCLGHRYPSVFSIWTVWAGCVGWVVLAAMTGASEYGAPHYWVAASVLCMPAVLTSMVSGRRKGAVRRIDLILGSYSGHTAHYAAEFAAGASEAGATVVTHRFHHYRSFSPDFAGEALVVAFPVYGCKPPWPLLYYLAFRLPRGGGKRAFVLYTCVGGAENAGMLCWLLLTLRGYSVVGRNWALYPANIPTIRIGPRRVWEWIDRLLPRPAEVAAQRECGRAFAAGEAAGIPFVFCLSPCFLVGMLADHKLIDTILYRNHVIKSRCNQCGVCIEYCPAERLTPDGGFPRASGACMICLGCVNHCPREAMHLWGWTEYGQPYKSRFWRRPFRHSDGRRALG